MHCQKLYVHGLYDDVKYEFGKEIRDEHVDLFRQAMADVAVELEKALPHLLRVRENSKDFAAVVRLLPDTLNWIRPFLFRYRTSITADMDAVDFIFDVLKSEHKADKGLIVLERLQSAKGLTWWKE